MPKDGFTHVAGVNEILPGQVKVVQVDQKPIAVFNIDGLFHAIYNVCPHEGGPLAQGRRKGCVIFCPWHDLAFDIRNGHATDGGGYCVGSYEVHVEGDDLYVGARRKF